MLKSCLKGQCCAFMIRFLLLFIILVTGAAILFELENNGIREAIGKNRRIRFESKLKIEKLRQELSATLNVSIDQSTFNKLVADIKSIPDPSDPSLLKFHDAGQLLWTIVTTVGKLFKFYAIFRFMIYLPSEWRESIDKNQLQLLKI